MGLWAGAHRVRCETSVTRLAEFSARFHGCTIELHSWKKAQGSFRELPCVYYNFDRFAYNPYSVRGLSSKIFFLTGSVSSVFALKMSMASTSLDASVWP